MSELPAEQRHRDAAANYMREAGWCVDYDHVLTIDTPLAKHFSRFERDNNLVPADQWLPIEALPELPMDERVIVYWPNKKIIAMENIRGITCLRQKDRPSHWRPMLYHPPEATHD